MDLARPRPISIALWGCLIFSLALLLYAANRGFSLLDEAYYVAIIADPAWFTASLHAYALPMHLIFVAFGKSLIALRLFGVVVLVSTTAILGDALKRYYVAIGALNDEPKLAAMGALFSLTYFVFWIMTPSYNLVVTSGAVLILAGALHWAIDDHDRKRTAWQDSLASLLVGLGGCFAFFGKAPFAVIAAVAIAIFLVRVAIKRGARVAVIRAAVTAVSCLIPLIATLEATGGVADFITKTQVALVAIDMGNRPHQLPYYVVHQLLAAPPTVVISALSLALVALVRWRRAGAVPPILRGFALAWLAFDLFTFLARAVYRAALGDSPWLYVGMPMIAICLALFTYIVARSDHWVQPAGALTPLGLLFAMPFATGFGTATPWLAHVGGDLYAFLLVIVLCGRLFFAERTARLLELVAILFCPVALLVSAFAPLELQNSIFKQTELVSLPFTADKIRVETLTRDYLVGLRRIAVAGGLKADTPIFDLSGGAPGTALLLNNRAPVYSWVLPMLPGSIATADGIWAATPPDQQRRAWIVGDVDPRLAASKVATSFLRRQHEYVKVGEMDMVFWTERHHIVIWKPRENSEDLKPAT